MIEVSNVQNFSPTIEKEKSNNTSADKGPKTVSSKTDVYKNLANETNTSLKVKVNIIFQIRATQGGRFLSINVVLLHSMQGHRLGWNSLTCLNSPYNMSSIQL